VCTVQNQADEAYQPNNQSDDNHNAQGIGFGFLFVIDGNDGVQQMIDVASIDLTYDKLHTICSAQIRPSRKVQNGTPPKGCGR
jgi:hypothetical protein